MSKFSKVIIVWDDAESSDGWDGIPDKLEPKLVISMGHLIFETDKHVLIAASVGHGDEDCNNRLQIPKSMIQTMEVIKHDISIDKPVEPDKGKDKRIQTPRQHRRSSARPC